MTTNETLVAGPELDFAVGKACRCQSVFLSPSTYLSDAFYAAEKFGLFDKGVEILKRPGSWQLGWSYHGAVVGNTLALAICAAILNLSQEKSSHDAPQ